MDANISSRINLMRIVLISGIVFVHVPHDPQTSPFLGTYGFLDWLRVFLGDSLFRVGVPCLSAISGYLMFRRGLDTFDYKKTLRTKARTVLLPFLLWNLAFLALVYVAQLKNIGFGYLPDVVNATPREWLSLAFALEALPINVPLYFLRDLLLCILLSPLLAWLIKRYPLQTLGVLLAFAVLPLPNGIFLKKSILFGFCTGIYLSLHRIDTKLLDPYARSITAVFLATAVRALDRSLPDRSGVPGLGRYAAQPDGTFRHRRVLGRFSASRAHPGRRTPGANRWPQLLDLLCPLSSAHRFSGWSGIAPGSPTIACSISRSRSSRSPFSLPRMGLPSAWHRASPPS